MYEIKSKSIRANFVFSQTHVHKDNVYDCNSYVQTLKKTEENRNPGVYALDCEMVSNECIYECLKPA